MKYKKILIAVISAAAALAVIFMLSKLFANNEFIHASVIGTTSNYDRYSNVKIKILNGDHKNEIITVQNIVNENIQGSEGGSTENYVKKGDEVLISIDEDDSGKIKSAYIYEIVKYKKIYFMIFMFALLIVIVGGKKGLKSLLSLAITAFTVIKILIPMILAGFNPVTVSVVVCIILSIVSLTIISGRNRKTMSAIIGTCGGVIFAGAIGLFYIYDMQLKGFNDDELQMLIFTTQKSDFDYRGLLFSGILMGALGAVMDVCLSIASSMNEIESSDKNIGFRELIKSGMNVGRDVIGSMCNTLILAYISSAMYVLILILSYRMPMIRILDQDLIATEILKSLSGSFGLILSIPITAFAYALLRRKEKKI